MMTPETFSKTKLGIDMLAKWGWGVSDWEQLAPYWKEAYAAAQSAGSQPARRGRYALKVKLKYAKAFGATTDELVRIERWDRGGMAVVGSGLMPEKFRDLFFCAQCMANAPESGKSIADLGLDAMVPEGPSEN